MVWGKLSTVGKETPDLKNRNGMKDKTSKNGSIKEWTCPLCEAPNHFDENGEVMDYRPPTPPSYETSAPNFLSRTVERKQMRSPFCENCLRNQLLVNRMLADFLPEHNHPDYKAYEAAFPKYKESLEEKFPIVCDKCYDPVHKQLEANNYEAKNHVLGQWLVQSKEKLYSTPSSSKNSFSVTIWVLRGIGFLLFYSHAMGWHLYHSIIPTFFPLFAQKILNQLSRFFLLSLSLSQGAMITWLGFFVIFWNPYWLVLTRDSSTSLYGREQYIRSQLISILIRLTSVYILNLYEFAIKAEYFRDANNVRSTISQIHTILFFVTIFFLIVSFSCLDFRSPRRINLTATTHPIKSRRSKSTLNTLKKKLQGKSFKRRQKDNEKPPAFPQTTPLSSHFRKLSEMPKISPISNLQKKLEALPTSSPYSAKSSPFQHASPNIRGKDSLRMMPTFADSKPETKNLDQDKETVPLSGKQGDDTNSFFKPSGIENLFSKTLNLTNEHVEVLEAKTAIRRRNGLLATIMSIFIISFLLTIQRLFELNRMNFVCMLLAGLSSCCIYMYRNRYVFKA
ncbi:integral inner nuclear membrane protein Ima1 [Schizosaccharomyces cryophilus OY26]|uniref:Integral inner nuclear membrane protein Ima1 n=1 Tax=Schizosaccharomyces cryophilus (strain OY26 / ATCC MYA-4695 / CBS 11777 / NBRC 106824 / NRRL Y48691) TaxID=653667 RepID=S9W0Z5_SCHCR|nr:integral inner nuclear membrane protein Ima1 [Schizosaccharomyces cryophilus OY26]EPY52124.1 integral inner nuclear membrane protein Ima1 [Schizosaccharomyces cryophilus OY26]